MIISYSETLSWDSCPRQYYYQNVLNLTPNELSEPITTGVKGHHLLQSFYRALQEGKDKETAKDYVYQSAKHLMESPFFDPNSMDLLKAWSLVNKYIDDTDFNVEIIEVENRFLIPLSYFYDDPFLSDVTIGFTPDVVFKRPGNYCTVEDSKFVGRAWSQKKLHRFPQAKLYGIFLRKMGYNITRSSIRFFNTTKSTITDYGDTPTLQEEKILIRDFVATVKEIVNYKRAALAIYDDPQAMSNTRRTMNYTQCDHCFFEQPCTMQAQGKEEQASKILKHMFRKNDYDYNS